MKINKIEVKMKETQSFCSLAFKTNHLLSLKLKFKMPNFTIYLTKL
jgi:hypothetical protein